MKEHLDQNSRNAVVTYRLQKCEQAMNEAALLAEGGCYDCAVTRLYYACFYIACALLISNGLECGTHAGVKRMLSLHFIASGTIDRKYMRTYSNLMQGRQLIHAAMRNYGSVLLDIRRRTLREQSQKLQ